MSFLDDESDPAWDDQAASDIKQLRSEGADIVIGLTHLGVDLSAAPYRSYDLFAELDKKSAEEQPDFILDGHSHTTMTEGLNGEPIMQTGTKLENVGLVVIDEKTEKIEDNFLYKVDDIIQEEWSDAEVGRLSDIIKKDVDDMYSQKICESEVQLNGTKSKEDAEAQGLPFPNGNRDGETNMGDLVTDAFRQEGIRDIRSREKLGVEEDHVVSLVNVGAIRAGVEKGDVTKKDLLSILPWSNTAYGVYVSGEVLLEALEAATHVTPEPDGGFPQVSGIDYTIDTSKEYIPMDEPYPGTETYGPKVINRVTINSINGNPFSKEDTYLVMTNDYCADGGNEFYLFKIAEQRFDTGVVDVDSVAAYIDEKLGGVIGTEYAEPAGRIRILTEPEKAANPMRVKASNKTVRYRKVKKSAVNLKPIKVTKAAGKVTYKKTSGSSRITVNKKTGVVRIRKGTKKKTYKFKVRVTAAGNSRYKPKKKTFTVKIKVR